MAVHEVTEQNLVPNVELTKSAVFAAAEERTGCTDWGDTSVFEPALDQLLASLEAEAHLNTAGRFSNWMGIVGRLSQRLLLQRERYDRVPTEISERPAFVIIGPPRTGTTLLQRLLALDPDTDALRYCDVAMPVPATRPGTDEDEAKIEEVSQILAQLYARVPDLLKMHEMEPRMPDEEVFLIDHSFMSVLGPLRARVPTYWTWVMQSGDLDGVYRELKHFIAYVGQHRTGSRWVLKAPHHLWMLRQLLERFPHAYVIWIHRDPARFVPSCASMSRAIRSAGSDTASDEQIGQDFLDLLVDGVSRAMDYRNRATDRRIVDIHYHDLMRDPQGTVGRIYAAFGLELPGSMPEAIGRYVAQNPRGKHGHHGYSAEAFGLRNEEIRERFSAYIEEYNVQGEDS
jgi:hypothetical protein